MGEIVSFGNGNNYLGVVYVTIWVYILNVDGDGSCRTSAHSSCGPSPND